LFTLDVFFGNQEPFLAVEFEERQDLVLIGAKRHDEVGRSQDGWRRCVCQFLVKPLN
jgi:hypothetical protein